MKQLRSNEVVGRLELGGSGLLIEGRIWSSKVGCLVDTGATVNILSLAWWRTHGQEDQLRPATTQIFSVDGRPMELYGQVDVLLEVGDRECRATFEVANIAAEAILGASFLKENRLLVDVAGERLLWESIPVDRGIHTPTGEACRVVASQTAVIAAGEEVLLDGCLVGQWQGEAGGLVEGLRDVEERRGILVGRALVDPREEFMPVRVFNPGQDPVIVYRDMTLGTVEPVKMPEEQEVTDQPQHCRVVAGGSEEATEAVISSLVEGVEEGRQLPLRELLRKHQNAFQMAPGDVGRATLVEHRIRTGDHPPIRQAPRRLAPHRRQLVDTEVDKMLEGGTIEPAEGPWASPVVLVKKKDGSMRFCVDYRRLNQVTVKDAYPLPRIDDSLDTLAGSCWFSTMDLVSGYWQVAMAPEDREKTAFSTHRGLFQFTVMPFGLCNAPGTFERLMEVAMRGLQWSSCLVYLDDIVVFSRDFESHLQRLGDVLGRLEDAGLKVKPSKCHLARRKVSFLGHVVSEEGIQTDPRKVEAVKDWPSPASLTEVRSFLGLAGYYRSFVPDFATVAKPLTALADKGRTFHWSEECEVAFLELKRLLTQSPILGYPEDEGQIVLDTDASDTGLGAVLSQVQRDREVVLSYGSRTLTKPERNYCVTRRELLGIIYGLRKFRHYLLGRHVLVRTDHAALKWVMAFKEPEGQVARWLQVLGTYDYTVEHRPGKAHGNADGLSRIPCRQCGMGDEDTKAVEACRAVTRQGARDPDVAMEVRAEWVADQRADPVLGRVYTWKETETTPLATEIGGEGYALKALVAQLPRLEIREGLLGRWWFVPGTVKSFQILVPEKRREEVWTSCHGGGVTGHMGRDRTLRRCQERFYWPDFRRDLTYWVATCPRCLERKPPPHPRKAKMGHVPVGLPMERMAIDIMGPLPETIREMKYIVVVVDYFTKWAEAIAIKNQEAATVARALVETVVCRFGAPSALHSDQGRNFQSRLFRKVTDLLEMSQTRTCAFNPKSDGLVERCNRTIEALLSAVVADDHSDWDDKLPYVMSAYRSSVHSTTGVTPNMMMLGRETAAPLSLLYPLEEEVGEGSEGYVAKLQMQMARAHEHAREEIKTSVARQTRNYDRRAVDRPIEIGAVVYYHHPIKHSGVSPKLQRFWTGPWEVTAQIGAAVYEIKKDRTKKVVHFDSLKVVPQPPTGAVRREEVRAVRCSGDRGILSLAELSAEHTAAESGAEMTPQAAAETLLALRDTAGWVRLREPVAKMGKDKKKLAGYVIPKKRKEERKRGRKEGEEKKGGKSPGRG